MPTLPIDIVFAARTLGFSVALDNGNRYQGYLDLGIPGEMFRCSPNATVTFDSEEDLVGDHACTCTLTSTTSKITAANGVVIDNPVPEEIVAETEDYEDNTMEVNGIMIWHT